jgi:hypothetical protein
MTTKKKTAKARKPAPKKVRRPAVKVLAKNEMTSLPAFPVPSIASLLKPLDLSITVHFDDPKLREIIGDGTISYDSLIEYVEFLRDTWPDGSPERRGIVESLEFLKLFDPKKRR